MAYNFHYTPTGTGVISGKEVLEQTEDAINDLGNTAISGVEEALDKAEQALTNSQNAVDDAQTALNTANNAEGVAIQAQTDVSNLSGTVTNIGNRVTTAEGNITNLQGRMTTAESGISGLNTRMGTAEGNITTLQSNVSTAQATANSAQQTANTARQQSYVLRYSSSSVTDNSTIAYSTLDNTDNIKSGDKVIDVDGKIFSVVSVDTANQTVTVGSALIDLALDGNVVHTNKNDDVSIPLNSTSAELGVTGGYTDITFLDKNDKKLSGLTLGNYASSKLSYVRLSIFDKDVNDNEIQDILEYSYVSNNANAYLRVYRDNFCTLGSSSYRWKGVYATNYYYGSNNVEFSTKFVTSDTAQTVSGAKTFSSNINVYNSDSTGNVSNIVLKNSKAEVGTEFAEQSINFVDKNDNPLAKISCYGSSGSYTRLYITASDSNNNSEGIFIRKSTTTIAILPTISSTVWLGNSTSPFYNVHTKRINGLTPSSLGMPSDSLSNIIDISGYLTVLDGSSANTYQAPSDGYIGITMNNCTGVQAYITGFWGNQIVRPTAGVLRFFMPICKNMTANILILGGTVDNARFFPCQGNV